MLDFTCVLARVLRCVLRERTKVKKTVATKTFDILKQYDFIAYAIPTPGTAFEVWKNSADPMKMCGRYLCTVPANIAGVPLFLFHGKHGNSLPMGIQLMTNYFEGVFELAENGEIVVNKKLFFLCSLTSSSLHMVAYRHI